jgi:hypothetical protein
VGEWLISGSLYIALESKVGLEVCERKGSKELINLLVAEPVYVSEVAEKVIVSSPLSQLDYRQYANRNLESQLPVFRPQFVWSLRDQTRRDDVEILGQE